MTPARPRRRQPIDWKATRERLDRALAATSAALEPSPERTRALLDERAKALAQVTPRKEPGTVLEALAFSLGTERYAIATRYVREVGRLMDLTPVPGLPPHFLGVTNLRGEILAVADLHQLFGVRQRGLSDRSQLIVLGTERPELGLLADEAQALVELPLKALLAPLAHDPGIGREAVVGVTQEALVVLDGSRLLAEPRLFVDQRHTEHLT
jgi:purine-binding chemotaxis protein CheW